MQHSHDIDKVGLGGSEEDHVHGLRDRLLVTLRSAMAYVVASQSLEDFAAVGGRGAIRGLGNPA